MTWSSGYILHTRRYAAGYEETLGVCKDFRENGEIVDGCKWLCSVHSTIKNLICLELLPPPPHNFRLLVFFNKVNLNTFHDIAKDFRFYEDPADEFKFPGENIV